MAVINLEIKDAIARVKSILSASYDGSLRSPAFLLAVSGGPDSQALLKAFPHVCAEFVGVKCIACGIDHGLRPEANSELNLAEDLASTMGVPFIRSQVHINGTSNIQCKARDARYERLYEIANTHECDYVVTAHHFDDKAETVLIRIIRGEGMGSLAVLPMISGRILRPLLNVTRANIMGYVKRWNLKFAIDPSNMNPHYLRSKVRHEIFPLLESINPNIKRRLVNLSDEISAHENVKKFVCEELAAMVMKQ